MAIAKIEMPVENTQAIHQAVIGPRSRTCDCSACASSMRNTGVHTRLRTGTRQPTHSAHTGRGSSCPRTRNTAERRPISHDVSTTAVRITDTIAARLTSTPSHNAAPATSGGSSDVRLISNNT